VRICHKLSHVYLEWPFLRMIFSLHIIHVLCIVFGDRNSGFGFDLLGQAGCLTLKHWQ